MGALRVQAVLDASQSGEVCRFGAVDAGEGANVGCELPSVGGGTTIQRQAKSNERAPCGVAITVTANLMSVLKVW